MAKIYDMRINGILHLLLFVVATSFGISCVSTKKYEELASEKRRISDEKVKISELLQATKNQMNAEISAKEQEIVNTQDALRQAQNDIQALQVVNNDLMMRYDKLLSQNQEILEKTSDEKMALADELSIKQQELDQKERELNFLEMKLKSQEENLLGLQEDVRIRERKLAELTSQLQAKDSMMTSLKESINEALRGFSAADLTVSEYNGRVYVSLSQNLLFAKGSTVIDPAGKEAIRKVASVLKDHPDIQINVEGHTDSDGSAAKNWDLSVNRATTVVKELTRHGLDPNQVIASGRALYFPIAPNDTEENKSRNRRTEIILSPNLDALYEMISS